MPGSSEANKEYRNSIVHMARNQAFPLKRATFREADNRDVS